MHFITSHPCRADDLMDVILLRFFVSLITAAFTGAAARLAIKTGGLATGRTADVAAWCFAARHMYAHSAGKHDGPFLFAAAALGGAAAMYGLFVWLLKKPPEHQAADD
jgi:hypothetical protein